MTTERVSFRKFSLGIVVLSLSTASAPAAPLIYYDGSGSGSAVTNLGTLGSAGNGTVTTDGAGSVTFQSAGGPDGAGDKYVDVASFASDGGWVTVPANALPSFSNDNWSIVSFFNRTATTNEHDMVFHVGSGDGLGGENELYVYGVGGSTNVLLQHYPNNDVNLSTSVTTGAWHHLAVTFTASGADDGKGTLSYYIDGTLVNSDSIFTLAMNQTLQWGGVGIPATQGNAVRGFTGGLDDFAFYNTVLTADEVAGLEDGSISPLDVPEPGSAMLVGMLGAGMLLRRRRPHR